MVKFYAKEKGAGLVEYALLVGLIAVVAIVAITQTGLNIASIFGEAKTGIAGSALSNITLTNNLGEIVVEFDDSEQASSGPLLATVGFEFAAGTPVYEATCTSQADASSVSASGTSSPIVVIGIKNGHTYGCQVDRKVDGVVTGSSPLATVETASVTERGTTAPGLNVYEGWTTKDAYYPGEAITMMLNQRQYSGNRDMFAITYGEVTDHSIAGPDAVFRSGIFPGDTYTLDSASNSYVWPLPPGEYKMHYLKSSGNTNNATYSTYDFVVMEHPDYAGPTQDQVRDQLWLDKTTYLTGETINVGYWTGGHGGVNYDADRIIITHDDVLTLDAANHDNVAVMVRSANIGSARPFGATTLNDGTGVENISPLPPGNYRAHYVQQGAYGTRFNVEFSVIPELGYDGPTQDQVRNKIWVMDADSLTSTSDIHVGWLDGRYTGDHIVITDQGVNPNTSAAARLAVITTNTTGGSSGTFTGLNLPPGDYTMNFVQQGGWAGLRYSQDFTIN